MSWYCHSLCEKYRVPRVRLAIDEVRYPGFKRCKVCAMYMLVKGNRCPCCRALLQTHIRAKSRKRVYATGSAISISTKMAA